VLPSNDFLHTTGIEQCTIRSALAGLAILRFMDFASWNYVLTVFCRYGQQHNHSIVGNGNFIHEKPQNMSKEKNKQVKSIFKKHGGILRTIETLKELFQQGFCYLDPCFKDSGKNIPYYPSLLMDIFCRT
jgi:hypothetical protein